MRRKMLQCCWKFIWRNIVDVRCRAVYNWLWLCSIFVIVFLCNSVVICRDLIHFDNSTNEGWTSDYLFSGLDTLVNTSEYNQLNKLILNTSFSKPMSTTEYGKLMVSYNVLEAMALKHSLENKNNHVPNSQIENNNKNKQAIKQDNQLGKYGITVHPNKIVAIKPPGINGTKLDEHVNTETRESVLVAKNITIIKNYCGNDSMCNTKPKMVLNIGGLFDLSGSRSESLGRSELTAAKLAIDHVNKENIMPGYHLKLLHNDTGCDPGVGMDALYDLIYRREQMVMVIGSACSEVTKTLAEIVPYWNLILVSFASTSPALSEREKYKTFFRLAPADSSQNAPRAMFITHFGWDTVATLYELEEDYSLAIDEMGSTFEQNNITIKLSTSFRRYDDIAANLKSIKDQDARIIIGGFSEKAARNVLCQAYLLQMYGPRYVWIIIGDYVERWWELSNETACTIEQLSLVAEGYFTIDSLNSLSDDDMSTANISLRQFMSGYKSYKGPTPMSPYATSTYDTVWTIALTLKKSLEYFVDEDYINNMSNTSYENITNNVTNSQDVLTSFTYATGAGLRHTFLNIMQNLAFLGISGPISFEGPDRKGISVISQNQKGRLIRIALYEPNEEKLNFYCRICRPIIWAGGAAPRDKYIRKSRQKNVDPLAFVCVSSVSLVGLLLASAFLAYNLYHRRLRYIKLSSPKLNNVAVVGCMLVYTGIIILGYDVSDMEEKYFPGVCTVRAFLFSAGFSLAFGAMFTKTYRVHQIFTRANRGLIKSKLLRDKQLLFIIGALLAVDTAVLLLWVVVDPMHKQVTNLNVEASENDEDLLFIYQLTTCHSEHLEKWTGGLYAYKGLLLVFGVYMAWETRSVKIPALNDSKYIGMNVYNVVIMSVIVVTLSNILSHQPTLAYVMESSFMLFSTTTTLCLLFLPKIYAIATYKGDPIIAASGITVDANCRRFVVDEKRELFYRAEVQNRVYKREIVELDQEINRLEQLLELPMLPYPKLTKELMRLLPESRVDHTPLLKRRIGHEREMCNSISDGGEICLGLSEDKSDDDMAIGRTQKHLSPKPFHRRTHRLSIKVAKNYAVSKLCKLRPRFSVGSVNFRQEYEDLKGSPTSPDSLMTSDNYVVRSRLSHPLLRQQAIEERRNTTINADLKQSSEKSETRTFESVLSDNENDTDSEHAHAPHTVTFHLPKYKTYLKVPPGSDVNGCDDDSDKSVRRQSTSRRKYGHNLDVPGVSDECRITPIDETNENITPKLRRAHSIIEHERRTRIRKLQNDLRKIQKELQDLDELNYDISIV